MPTHDHPSGFRGRAFLWGGIGFGMLLVAALLTHGFGLWSGSSKAAAEQPLSVRQGDKIVVPEGSPLRSRLEMSRVATQPSSARLTLPGSIESDPARTAAVLPQLSGRVIDLKVRLGDHVTQGQVLMVLDSADLAQAYSDFDRAGDAFKLTQLNLGRQQEQAKIGVASDKDLDQSKSDNAQAESEYHRAVARLRMLNAPTGSERRRQLLVRAPLSGSITTLNVTPGSIINDPSQPVMTIADLSVIWVTALVPEKDIENTKAGQEAQITLLAAPERTLAGKVLFVSDVLEPDSRRNKVRIALANANYALKPNMFATVTLSSAARSRILLPSSALLMNNDRTSVFVLVAPWVFERRTVDAQLDDGPLVSIESGVSAGEQVVVKGGILLND